MKDGVGELDGDGEAGGDGENEGSIEDGEGDCDSNRD